MASAAFLQILIGLLIVAIDISLNGVDVLFDLVGYVLIFSGCSKLETQSRAFVPAKVVAAVAGILSVLQSLHIAPAADLVSAGISACDVMTTWFVCSGIIRMALDRGQTELAHMTTNVRLWSLIVGIVAWSLGTVARVAPPVAAVVAIPLMIVGVVLAIAFLVVLHRASVQLA